MGSEVAEFVDDTQLFRMVKTEGAYECAKKGFLSSDSVNEQQDGQRTKNSKHSAGLPKTTTTVYGITFILAELGFIQLH